MKKLSTDEYFGEDKHLAETDKCYPRTLRDAFPHSPTLTQKPILGGWDLVLVLGVCVSISLLVGEFCVLR